MAKTRITISLSPELIQQLDEQWKQMTPRPSSLAKVVVRLLQEQLGGQDQGYTLDVRRAGPLQEGPGKVVNFETFSITVPGDVELPPS